MICNIQKISSDTSFKTMCLSFAKSWIIRNQRNYVYKIWKYAMKIQDTSEQLMFVLSIWGEWILTRVFLNYVNCLKDSMYSSVFWMEYCVCKCREQGHLLKWGCNETWKENIDREKRRMARKNEVAIWIKTILKY